MRDGDGQAGARARRHGARFGHASEATRAGLSLLVCVVGRRPSPPSPALYNHHLTPPPSPHCHRGEHAFLAPVLLWSHPPRLLPPSSSPVSSPLFSRLAHSRPFLFVRQFLHRVLVIRAIFCQSVHPPRISPVTPSPHFLRPEFRRSQLIAYSPIALRQEEIGKDCLCQMSWWCRTWSCSWR